MSRNWTSIATQYPKGKQPDCGDSPIRWFHHRQGLSSFQVLNSGEDIAWVAVAGASYERNHGGFLRKPVGSSFLPERTFADRRTTHHAADKSRDVLHCCSPAFVSGRDKSARRAKCLADGGQCPPYGGQPDSAERARFNISRRTYAIARRGVPALPAPGG